MTAFIIFMSAVGGLLWLWFGGESRRFAPWLMFAVLCGTILYTADYARSACEAARCPAGLTPMLASAHQGSHQLCVCAIEARRATK